MPLNTSFYLCAGKLELPLFQFTPAGNEIAFQGGEYTFSCQAKWIEGTQLNWYKDKKLVPQNNQDKNGMIAFMFNVDQVTNTSTFHIQHLSFFNEGTYMCNVSRPGGYMRFGESKLHVIPSNSKICQAESTVSDRGEFHWHNTVAGGIAYIKCPVGYWKPWKKDWKEGMAKRHCSYDGKWIDVEDSGCAYANKITRNLHSLNGVRIFL